MIIKCCWLQVYFWSFLDWLSDFLYCPSFTIIWSNLYAIFLSVFLVFSFVLSFNSIFLIVFIANNLFFYSFLFSLSFSLCHNFFFFLNLIAVENQIQILQSKWMWQKIQKFDHSTKRHRFLSIFEFISSMLRIKMKFYKEVRAI